MQITVDSSSPSLFYPLQISIGGSPSGSVSVRDQAPDRDSDGVARGGGSGSGVPRERSRDDSSTAIAEVSRRDHGNDRGLSINIGGLIWRDVQRVAMLSSCHKSIQTQYRPATSSHLKVLDVWAESGTCTGHHTSTGVLAIPVMRYHGRTLDHSMMVTITSYGLGSGWGFSVGE